MISTDELERRFQRALDIAGNTHSVQDVIAAVEQGKMQSWQEGESVVLTEIIAAPQTNVCNIFAAVGALDEVMKLQPKIERFAREMGCSKMVMRGRKGWAKVLPDYGWASPGVIYELPLT